MMQAQAMGKIKRIVSGLLCAAMLLAAGCTPAAPVEAAPQSDANLGIGLELDEQASALPEAPGEWQDNGEMGTAEYVVLEDRVLGLYEASAKQQSYFVETANALFATMPTLSRYLMLVPMRISFEADADVRSLSDDEKADIEQVYFQTDKTVKTVDAYYALQAHAEPLDDIFFRLDHHWTQLGAYYTAAEFFTVADMAYHTLEEYEKKDAGTFEGYLFARAQDKALLKYPDKLTYYTLKDAPPKSATVYEAKTPQTTPVPVEGKVIDTAGYGYGIFVIHKECAYAVIQGEPESERSLMIVGDSLINAFSTWMSDSFKTVILVDPRYFGGGNAGLQTLIEEHGITDFLLLTTASTVLSTMEYFNGRLHTLTQ